MGDVGWINNTSWQHLALTPKHMPKPAGKNNHELEGGRRDSACGLVG